jgi:hypothetical protein
MNSSKRIATIGNDKLSPRQDRVAACLAAGRTKAAAARECHVGIATIHRWFRESPAFRKRIDELRTELVDRAVGRLADLMAGAAVDRLASLLGAESESLRLDAVKAVYELFVHVTNAADLKGRIEQLEADLPRKSR